jgi:predicted SnoaL-like aldol condensation-catalyzing enzyme
MKILRFKFPLLGLACWLLLAGMPQAQAADATGEANKKIVLAFYDAALVKFDAELARQYLGDKYIQHNPTAPDGVEGVMGLIKFLKEKFPLRKSDVKRVIADGDLVVLHVHSKPTPEDRGTAIVDIFRVEGGKIVEHWDVIQPVPETAKNPNTMF